MWQGIYFRLRPGMKARYFKAHRNVPRALKATLRRAGIHNYTIWCYEDMLFACYQVDDPAQCEAVLDACEAYQAWRSEMETIVYMEPGTGQKEWPMELAFLLE